MDRLSAMEIFVRVAETGSFTKAAEQLGLSTSAVSKQVIALEQRLGARLLNRTTRRVGLTEVGTDYYERCRRIAAEVEAAEQAVTHLHATPRGRLKVAAPVSFGALHLAPALPALLDRCPELGIELGLNDRFVDLIEEGFDVAVRIGALADSSLIQRRLAPCRRVVCGAPAYFDAKGVPASPDDLDPDDCLGYAPALGRAAWRLRRDGRDYTVPEAGRLQVDNGDALAAALRAGAGVALLPTFIVGPDLKAGRLQAVLTDYQTPEIAVHAVYPENRHLTAKVRVFVDFLAECFGPEPYWDSTG